MKAPHFWYQPELYFWANCFKPFSKITILANKIRQKVSQPSILPVPVICCGNVTVGGSGKTPLALEFSKILKKEGFSPHFLTRGYGRKKKYATPQSLYIAPSSLPSKNLKLFGDEALLLGRSAPCWIDTNRKRAAQLAYKAGADCLILDDGFQSPALHKDLNLLLFNGSHAIGNGNVLPAGPLREPLSEAIRRADYAIIVGQDRFKLSEKLKESGLPSINVSLSPSKSFLRPFLSQPICAFAGIAFPDDFFGMLSRHGLKLLKTYSFPDHHIYSQTEIQKLFEISQKYPLLTTAKDAVKFPDSIRKFFSVVDIEVTWHSIEQRNEIFQILFEKYRARLSK